MNVCHKEDILVLLLVVVTEEPEFLERGGWQPEDAGLGQDDGALHLDGFSVEEALFADHAAMGERYDAVTERVLDDPVHHDAHPVRHVALAEQDAVLAVESELAQTQQFPYQLHRKPAQERALLLELLRDKHAKPVFITTVLAAIVKLDNEGL